MCLFAFKVQKYKANLMDYKFHILTKYHGNRGKTFKASSSCAGNDHESLNLQKC